MENRVLPDIQNSKVKPERLNHPPHRNHLAPHQTPSPSLLQGRCHKIKIRQNLRPIAIENLALPQRCQLPASLLQRQPSRNQLHISPPRLATMRNHRSRRPQHCLNPFGSLSQRLRNRLHPRRQRQPLRQALQLALQHQKRIHTQPLQRLGRHLSRHTRMTIPITAHPRPKREPRHHNPSPLTKPSPPCSQEPLIQTPQNRRENVPQIVQHVPPLIRQRRLLQQDFTRPPKTLQPRLQLAPQLPTPHRR